jgi:predicted dehydrogenase
MNRRHFLKTSGAGLVALTATTASRRLFAAEQDKPLRVGLIGSGWYGKTDLFHLIQVAPVEVVGLCDVDRLMLENAAQLVAARQASKKKPALYTDYRKLLSDQQPEVVLIGTPDHWHCLPMIDACKAGADVYVQKPISYDVVEGQAMVAAARKYKRTVQVGLERRSTPHILEARDKYIRSGKLGRIASVDIHSYYGSGRGFPAPSAPPDTLDWEMYVGPAKWRDYSQGIHPRRWRDCREFSNGQTGDLCVHLFDVTRMFLDLRWPKSISATGGNIMRDPNSRVNVHDTQTALFDYGDVQVVWNQRNWGHNPEPDFPWGVTFYGDKGTLKLSVWQYEFIPRGGGSPERAKAVEEREKYPEDLEHKETEVFAAPANRRHLLEFVQARLEGRRPSADIEEGHISSACCILANLSMELGRSLRWDAEAEKVIGDDEANRRLASPYRAPWTHPTPDSV